MDLGWEETEVSLSVFLSCVSRSGALPPALPCSSPAAHQVRYLVGCWGCRNQLEIAQQRRMLQSTEHSSLEEGPLATGIRGNHFKNTQTGLPWWLSGKEPACQCRRHKFSPWSWKIPHAKSNQAHEPKLLSLSSGAQKLQLLRPEHTLEPVLHKREATAMNLRTACN